MDRKRIDPLLLWGSFYSYAVTGISVLIIGAILPFLLREFDLGYDGGGTVLALQALGNLCASFISGIVSDYVGRKPVLLFGALCFVIGFGGIFFISSSALLFVLLFIAGIGWGIMNSVINAIINEVSGGRSDIMNLLHMFFAIGAFSAPFIVSILERVNISWQYSLLVLAAMAAILFIVFLIMPVPVHHRDKKNIGKSSKLPFTNIRYYLFMALLFLYVGTENSINGWIVTYLDELGIMNKINPQDILSIFWVAIILGRLISAVISKYLSREMLILIFASGGGVSFVFFLLTQSPVLIAIWVFLMGLLFAGTFPTIIANSGPIIHGSGAATGIMLSFGSLGGAVFPYINGIIAEFKGLYAGMTAIMITATFLVIATITNLWLGTRSQ